MLNQVKRSARRASFEAERVLRIERAQARISSLNGQLRNGITRLGHLTYELAQHGKIVNAELRSSCKELDDLRAQVSALEAEIAAIRAETFVESPAGPRCARCGAACGTATLFCATCGASLQQTGARVVAESGVACARCGGANTPGAQYCVACGHALTAPVVPAMAVRRTTPTQSDTGTTPPSRLQSRALGNP